MEYPPSGSESDSEGREDRILENRRGLGGRWWVSEKERALGFREIEGEKVLLGFAGKGREVVVVVKSVAMDDLCVLSSEEDYVSLRSHTIFR